MIEEKDKYVKIEGQYDWKKDGDNRIFGDIKANTVSETIKYHVGKNNLNTSLKPSTIRRLCFTRIKKIFTLADKDIYDLWTQHKAGLITRYYIVDLLSRTIENEYVEKIQEKVLIGNVETYIEEIKNYKNGMQKINALKQDNKELRNTLDNLNKRIDNITSEHDKKIKELTELISEIIKNDK